PEEERFMTLPVDRGELPNSTEGDMIADRGWDTLIGSVADDAPGVSDDDDATEVIANNLGAPGDGLSRLQEYRGFVVSSVYERTDPRLRDVFFVYENTGDYLDYIGAPNAPLLTPAYELSLRSSHLTFHLVFGQSNPTSTNTVEYGFCAGLGCINFTM